MKFVIRRVAALFTFLGMTSTIGAILNQNSPVFSLNLFLGGILVMLATINQK